MPYTEVVARAVRGEIEGIATRSGHIKCLRLLPEKERERAPEATQSQVGDSGSSTAFARTNLGVYRQPLREVVVAGEGSDRRVASEGGIIGHCFAFCGLRGEGAMAGI